MSKRNCIYELYSSWLKLFFMRTMINNFESNKYVYMKAIYAYKIKQMNKCIVNNRNQAYYCWTERLQISMEERLSYSTCFEIQFSSVQLLSCVRLFATPWIAARQASLSITNSQSSLRLTSIESVMPSSHLILCHPLLLLPPIPPSIRVFSNESALRKRWPKYWSW